MLRSSRWTGVESRQSSSVENYTAGSPVLVYPGKCTYYTYYNPAANFFSTLHRTDHFILSNALHPDDVKPGKTTHGTFLVDAFKPGRGWQPGRGHVSHTHCTKLCVPAWLLEEIIPTNTPRVSLNSDCGPLSIHWDKCQMPWAWWNRICRIQQKPSVLLT